MRACVRGDGGGVGGGGGPLSACVRIRTARRSSSWPSRVGPVSPDVRPPRPPVPCPPRLLAGMNLLVCTPGRLLQHMDETPGFDAGQLQLLVLDEADRILDMVGGWFWGGGLWVHCVLCGPVYTYIHLLAPAPPPSLPPALPQGFSATLNAIVANLPRQRQTLLFSATQTKSVKDLARLSLKVGGDGRGGGGGGGCEGLRLRLLSWCRRWRLHPLPPGPLPTFILRRRACCCCGTIA